MGTYLRGFQCDIGEPEIVYKIETPIWMSSFDNQTTVSILKQGSKTVDWMSGETGMSNKLIKESKQQKKVNVSDGVRFYNTFGWIFVF